jgi:hypothetical protein
MSSLKRKAEKMNNASNSKKLKHSETSNNNDNEITSDEDSDETPPKYKFRPPKYPGLRDRPERSMIIYREPISALNTENNESMNQNVLFFRNELESQPRGDLIVNIHTTWWGDYEKLEKKHDYIQWLFPLRTQGLNSYSQELQYHEIIELKTDKSAKDYLKRSYEMMLDFYGMKLKSPDSTEVTRAENYKDRYTNLINRRHNNLRIARILQCLGDFELHDLQLGWINFFIKEVFGGKKRLISCGDSLTAYWVQAIKTDSDRERAIKQIEDLL